MQTSKTIKQEILNLEKKYWTAMKDQDLETALSLTDFPCFVAGARGYQVVDRPTFEKMFKSHEGSIKSFDFDETKFDVKQVSPDTVVSAYQIQSSANLPAVDTSTWIRKNNKWVCTMHTETQLAK